MNISEMLARNAELYPDETALIELTPGKNLRKEITWRQFDENANKIAQGLKSMGITKGDRVIQLMRNSNRWLEVYFRSPHIKDFTENLAEQFVLRNLGEQKTYQLRANYKIVSPVNRSQLAVVGIDHFTYD